MCSMFDAPPPLYHLLHHTTSCINRSGSVHCVFSVAMKEELLLGRAKGRAKGSHPPPPPPPSSCFSLRLAEGFTAQSYAGMSTCWFPVGHRVLYTRQTPFLPLPSLGQQVFAFPRGGAGRGGGGVSWSNRAAGAQMAQSHCR